jgi:hypothetical protein
MTATGRRCLFPLVAGPVLPAWGLIIRLVTV